MAIQVLSTEGAAFSGVKLLVYGQAGTGKTMLCATAPNPIILSAESGLLTLRKFQLPYITITSIADLREAYTYVKNSDFSTICIDSISEIAEVCLAEEKEGKNKDPRFAYGEMQSQTTDIIRKFRDIDGKNIYMTAKLEKELDKNGVATYTPSLPGKKMTQGIGYFFDEVFVSRVQKTEQGDQHFLQCKPDGFYEAKDRSGVLDVYEKPDLTYIFQKVVSK